MRIRKSDVVLSLAGRDREGLFLVLRTDGGFCWLADGKGRTVEKPKRKNLRHLRYVCRGEGPAAEKLRGGEPVTDKEVRKTLAFLKEDANGAKLKEV